MIGVFISFTLSQTGMVVHWRQTQEPGWKTSALINGFGALHRRRAHHRHGHEDARGRVDRPAADSVIVTIFKATRRHYDHVAAQLTLRNYDTAARACTTPS